MSQIIFTEQLFKDYNTAYLAVRFNNIKQMLENDRTDDAVEYFRKSVDYLRTGGLTTCIDITKDTIDNEHYKDMQAHMSEYFIQQVFKNLIKHIWH